jgi:predicted acylesterase/phospholipase RssA
MKALLNGESSATGYAPLDPDIYTGTSGGAFNVAIMVSQPDIPPTAAVRHLEQIWVDHISENPLGCGNGVFRIRGNPFQYVAAQCIAANPVRPFVELAGDATFFAVELFRRSVNFLFSSGSLERRVFEFVDLGQLIDDRPFVRGLPALVDLAGIRRSEKILRIIATNWLTGAVTVFGNADLTDEIGHALVHGSAAIPGVFPPKYAAGVPYVDGGLVMNVPLEPAIEAGADTLHVVYYDPNVKNVPLTQVANTLDIINRSRMIDWAVRINEDIETARWINNGLDAIARLARGEALSADEKESFARVSFQILERDRLGDPYRKLTIHRYHPRDDPAGPIGLLNFDRDHIVELLERGFTDAVAHNCAESECLLLDGSQRHSATCAPPVSAAPTLD